MYFGQKYKFKFILVILAKQYLSRKSKFCPETKLVCSKNKSFPRNDNVANNGNFGRKQIFWSKFKNRNFDKNLFVKNRNFRQRAHNFSPKINILFKN